VQLDGLRLLLTQPDRRSQDAGAKPGRHVSRLPRQWAHDGAVPSHSRHPATGAPLPSRYDQPARGLQSTDPWIKAQPPVGGRLHRVRAAHRVFQWR
jgi:hypothetical protein